MHQDTQGLTVNNKKMWTGRAWDKEHGDHMVSYLISLCVGERKWWKSILSRRKIPYTLYKGDVLMPIEKMVSFGPSWICISSIWFLLFVCATCFMYTRRIRSYKGINAFERVPTLWNRKVSHEVTLLEKEISNMICGYCCTSRYDSTHLQESSIIFKYWLGAPS